MPASDKHKAQQPKLTRKEKAFLKGLDEAIEFVNNYPKEKTAKKEKILLDLEESVRWVKDYEAGKIEAKTLEQLLEEL